MRRLIWGIITVYTFIFISTHIAFWGIDLYKSKQVIQTRFTPIYKGSLGNDLSAYFYYMNSYIPDHSVCTTISNSIPLISDMDLRRFYQKLTCIKNANNDSFISDSISTWNQYDFHGMPKHGYLNYWKKTRSSMQKIYNDALDNSIIAVPVVHFRCSDVPFDRHPQYHLTKVSSVKWMAQNIKNRGYNKIILLSCNTHISLDQSSCARYTAFYADVFKNEGLSVDIQCNTIYRDFAMMVKTPLLVSLNASSYSFLAGVAKAPNEYIACNMGVELDGKYILQTEADWHLDASPPLLHSDVENYHNVAEIINLLHDS